METRGSIAGLVLAGGRSLRMGGQDKALASLGGQSLLAQVLARLAPQVAACAISTNADPQGLAGLVPAGTALLPDRLPPGVPERPGPLAGVLAGLDWAAGQGAAWLVSLPVDTPFAPVDLVARLQAALPPGAQVPVMAESPSGLHPVVALWPVALRAPLAAALVAGERRVRAWALAQGGVCARFEAGPGGDPFDNLNTPAEFAQAEHRLSEQRLAEQRLAGGR